jgi:hypothetical protein
VGASYFDSEDELKLTVGFNGLYNLFQLEKSGHELVEVLKIVSPFKLN